MAVPEAYADLWSKDRDAQHDSFTALFAETETPVDWAYEVWDDVVDHLASPDNHDRSIAAQLLCRLAASDPQGRLRTDLPRLLAVTHDERFVTARHALQSLWYVGALGGWRRDAVLKALESRFESCAGEKNCTLIRFDIVVVLKRMTDESGDPVPSELAARLALSEPDPKYRKKYEAALR
ncbi:MAG TPA: hypothetical protein VFH17_03085 [Coriobacteriia bacterium]|nr:hypothetical protein [Coriobacteriia bacterium]